MPSLKSLVHMSGSISADITSGVGDFEGGDDLLRAWVEGLTPDADLSVSQWADQYRMLASRASAEPRALSHQPHALHARNHGCVVAK